MRPFIQRWLKAPSTICYLIHDFAKAYDSVSRQYLFSVLRKVGLPDWIMNVLDALFTNVVATPILQEGHGVKLFMRNGLKQGCPLSPLLYNLVLDPHTPRYT